MSWLIKQRVFYHEAHIRKRRDCYTSAMYDEIEIESSWSVE